MPRCSPTAKDHGADSSALGLQGKIPNNNESRAKPATPARASSEVEDVMGAAGKE